MKKIALLGIFLLVFASTTLALDASFTADQTSGALPLTVEFTVTDTTGITGYAWDFGDTTSSSDASPVSHEFTTAGIYVVELNVTDGENSTVAQQTITVEERNVAITTNPTALVVNVFQNGAAEDLDLDVTNTGNVPIDVALTFTDLSDGTNTISATSYITGDSVTTVGVGNNEALSGSLASLPNTILPGVYTGNFTLTATDVDGIAADYELSGVVTLTVEAEPSGVSVEITNTEIVFGDENQEREEDITAEVTVKNTGASAISGIDFVPSSGLDDYNVQFSQTGFSLAAQQEVTVTMTITIPDDQDSGTKTLGTLGLSATSPSNIAFGTNIDVTLETISHLDITDIDYDIQDGESDNLDVDGTRDKFGDDPEPGDEIILTVEVENNFRESIDIEDVKVEIEREDRDVDFDSTKEEVSRIKDDDSDIFEFTFTIDSDADEDLYSFDIEVTGDDENGAEHTDSFTVEFDVERPSNELTIVDARIIPSRVTCEDTVRLEVVVENTGSNNLKSAAVEAISDFFDFRERDTNIRLDDGDDYTAKFNVDISDLDAGTYPIDLIAYYKLSNDDDTDNDFVDLIVGTCSSDNTDNNDNTGNNNNGGTTTTPPPDFDDFPTGNAVYGDAKSGDGPDVLVLVLLGLGVLIVIILIIALLVKATPQK